jgi:serine/threonine protein kinase
MTPDNPHPEAGVREGEILAGKYRVERVLGIGGMGVVVAAQHVQLDEKVAIKFLLPTMLRNQEVVGRFAREARAAVKIKSEHVARVFDVGTLEDGAPYMVMEFLEGVDLAAWLQRQGPLPIEQAVDFVLQACVAVANAHGLGVVHRDLKPANLFCTRGSDGQFVVKVLDFGISKVTSLSGAGTGGSMTQTSAVMGSPYYMSPEQMQSAKDVDARTDIWALGVVLYELLTGGTPFAGESFAEIAIKVATAGFPSVRVFRPETPARLEAVLLKCLEKNKELRYANVAELALALGDLGSRRSRASIEKVVDIIQASGLSTSALALPPSPLVGASSTKPSRGQTYGSEPPHAGLFASTGTMAPAASTTPGSAGRSRATAILGVVAALAVAAAGVGLFLTKRAPATVAAAAPAATALAPEPQKPTELPPPAETFTAPTAAAEAASAATRATVPPHAAAGPHRPPSSGATSSAAPTSRSPSAKPTAQPPAPAPPEPSPLSPTESDPISRLKPKQ